MLQDFIEYFRTGSFVPSIIDGELSLGEVSVPVKNGIPRFTPDESYSSGNFSRLREEHATLQLDSVNNTTDRLDTLLERTQWPKSFFKGKTILECGCGAGPDTEVLLNLGAKVISIDLAGVDVARENLGDRPELCLVQASIDNIPLKRESFDIVFCHRVIMHTPDPEKVLNHILQFVKPDGAVFIHSYSRDFHQMFRWKYLVRPLSRRMDPERLYRRIQCAAPPLFWLTNLMNRNRLTRRLAYICVPFINHRYKTKFNHLSDAQMLEYGVHETFDAMSPRYDNPLSRSTLERYAKQYLSRPYEIVQGVAVTILRTKLDA